MKEMDISEYAYKNGYEKGFSDGKNESIKRGRWIKNYGNNHSKFGCSNCHRTADLSRQSKNFCSYCGSFNGDDNEITEDIIESQKKFMKNLFGYQYAE